ncbi:MAG: gamma-glutamyltransferase [Gemmatimonadetes bacterium]|nr:gamma-glutamyltransferase [Gemmatimonadota bacterium]MYE69741.1 gamma-glutamyltransferase [Gemmatimonadota bacterium]MYJ69861.1 gamma-glutamyltransferase [Gemmatimonadota bacterium]
MNRSRNTTMDLSPGLLSPSSAPAALFSALVLLSAAACGAPNPARSANEATGTAGIVFPPTNRPDVRGVAGAVSAGHPLAAAAGHDVLRRGGNAMDAAIAMAGVLAVVRPHMNGVGGDAFALYYEAATGQVHALNGSGRAGALATPELFAELGVERMPGDGPLSVSVPGAVAAWVDALDRFGTMPREALLAPAIGYARDGFPISTRLASDIESSSGALNDHARALYLPGGEPPPTGSLLRNPALAATLERIARDGKAGFYQGTVAERLAAFIETGGGYLRAPDLASHTTTWVEPLRGGFEGYTMLVLPPNTQGIAQLQLFEMATAFDLKAMGPGSTAYLHTLIEMKKLAFADRDQWAADPEFTDIPLDHLLDPAYLASRAAMVDPNAAAESREPGVGARMAAGSRTPRAPMRIADATAGDSLDDSGDTVYLTAVDRWGNAVSWIQSLFAGFGSGLLEPETGVVLHNRGALFNLDPGHPNIVAPGKRPYHTLTPMMALNADGTFAFTLGTPGGDSQPQSLLQIVNNLVHFGMTPQAAIEAPRFRSYNGLRVAFEDRFPASVLGELVKLGHQVDVVHGWTATFGGAQMILRGRDGTLTAASDPRREAYSIAW